MPLAHLSLRDCSVDLLGERVLCRGEVLGLTTLETRLLAFLAERGEATREELQVEVWGYSAAVRSRAVDALVQRLRLKIEADPAQPEHLLTVWGQGYRLRLGEPDAGEVDRFFGRDRERRELADLLACPGALVTITGPSGVGKSRLARHCVPEGSALCSLDDARGAQAHGVESLLPLLFGALQPGTVRGTTQQLARLAEGRVLVLDGADRVGSELARLLPVLRSARPAPTLVITRQEPLGLAGERCLELGPLDAEDAVALLRDRASDPRWADSASSSDLHTIASRLDALPLALELAGGLSDVLAPAALLARLDRALELLVSCRRDRPPRHHSLRGAVEHSLDLLPGPLREDLLQLAVFRGGFSLEAAQEQLGQGVLERVLLLRRRALLRTSPRCTGRLELYGAVRALALEELQRSPLCEEAHERFRRSLVRQAAERVDPGGSCPRPETLRWLAQELDNLVAAFELSLPEHPEDAARLALAAYPVLAWQGPVARAVELLDACLAHPPEDLGLLGHLHRCRGLGLFVRGRVDSALQEARRAQDLGREGGDAVLVGRAAGLAGIAELHLGHFVASLDGLRAALLLAQEARDTAYEASIQGNLGTALWVTDARGEAEKAYTRAVKLHRRLGNPRSAAILEANLGLLAAERRELGRARSVVQAALGEHRRCGDRVNEAVALGHLARVALIAGELREGEALATQGIGLLEQVGESESRARLLVQRSAARWALGELDLAWDDLRQARVFSALPEDVFGERVLLDLLLRLDGGEQGDPHRALEGLPGPGPFRGSQAQHALAGAFVLEAGRGPLRRCEELCADLALATEPYLRELRRRARHVPLAVVAR